MFRLTQYMHELVHPTPPRRRGAAGGVKPVVIWNLTRTCNLSCRHCYTTWPTCRFRASCHTRRRWRCWTICPAFGIPALILSGGEPLSRFDFWQLAERARALDFRHLSLSTNGTRLGGADADRVAALGFDYVGISLDGIGAMNDWFRGRRRRLRRGAGGGAGLQGAGREGGAALHPDRGQRRDAARNAGSVRRRGGGQVLSLASGLCRARRQAPRRGQRATPAPARRWTC